MAMPDDSATLPHRIADLDRRARSVRGMFTSIAARYDLLNRLLSAGVDQRWRRRTAALSVGAEGDAHRARRVLDVCCGTGDLALAYSNALPDALVVGADFSPGMLAVFRKKTAALDASRRGVRGPRLALAVADTLRLPFADGSFDMVSIGFGVRNLVDLRAGLREMARVTRPGGKVVVLEFSQPPKGAARAAYFFYLNRLLPGIGHMLSGSKARAYRYLAETIRAFPAPDALAQIMKEEGAASVTWTPMTFGVVSAHVGVIREGRGADHLSFRSP